ncbi:MAG TPA: amino acid ABC transporter substrate-binding protein [Casimicrobiaceae bacterium]|nr:amino acid ABC transporter substrate-binding protein [Casimicrobiaceae bacterium]
MADGRAAALGARVAACLILFVAAAHAADTSTTLERIRTDGSIRLGYRSGAAPFSFKERDGSVRGYSVEICTRIVASLQKRLGLASLRIEWTPLDAAERLDAVAKGKVDMECGTTTISLSRYETVDFSLPIFVDGGSVLTAATSKLERFADLDSRRVAVIPGTTTESALKRQLAVTGTKAQLVPVKDGFEGIALLSAGKVDGYASDRIVLVALRAASADPARWELFDNDFSFEPYALVVRRDDPDFRLAVNRALVELYGSGDIDAIFYRWLAGLGRPGPLLNAMFYLSTLPQ